MELNYEILPAELATIVERYFADFKKAAALQNISLQANPHWLELPMVWMASEFVARYCIRRPGVLMDLLHSGDLARDYSADEYLTHLQSKVASAENEQMFCSFIRQYRQREMCRIAWRDLSNTASLPTTLNELSALADACVKVTSAFAQQALEKVHGFPCASDGTKLDLIILGMGKLGGNELNFSSDIDLIYAFVEEGSTVGGSRPLAHSQFFNRVAQKLGQILSNITEEGFVFRVDARLRPFGDSGQLSLSFSAIAAYYENHGREWERYALIKARVISGSPQAGDALQAMLKPFVYRRYLDFSAFDSLRDMKRMMVREVKRKKLHDNVKLGFGGIREIEFIGQAFQLIRGGREKRLQTRSILGILQSLADLAYLPAYIVDELIEAYLFLRKTENRIQEFADQQSHSLPSDEIGRLRLAYAMGFVSWAQFSSALEKVRETVHSHFNQVFAAPQAEDHEPQSEDLEDAASLLWGGLLEKDEAVGLLMSLGYQDAQESYRRLSVFASSKAVHATSKSGRSRLDKLMPMILNAVAKVENPDPCFFRVLDLLENITRRTAYLALLMEYPIALSQLIRLFAISPWIANLLIRSPILLDELLDPRRLYEPMLKAELEQELKNRLAIVEVDDTEMQMAVFQQFKQANSLRVAAAQITQITPVEKVSDYLSYIAETIVENVLQVARKHLLNRHGKPTFLQPDGARSEAQFGIIAYGKLGGFELGFGSDLDLVFLHDTPRGAAQTDGEKPIPNTVFFARLAQRIIHLLNTPAIGGALYEVDTRLRPNGSSGLLVSSMQSFVDYQQNKAWTWEHQAIIRARVVAGDSLLGERFADIRRRIICQSRDSEVLRADVSKMRTRIRREKSSHHPGMFDLKQDPGGITDIEFIIQYLVLRWAAKYPELVSFTDNLRLLEIFAKVNVLTVDDAKMLANAYLAFRQTVHELALRQQPTPLVEEALFTDFRSAVTRVWDLFLTDPKGRLPKSISGGGLN